MKDRRGSDAVARKIMLRVLHENRSQDELMHEAAAMQPTDGLTVNWGANGQQTNLRSVAPIVSPDGQQLSSYGRAPSRVCGQCKKFNVGAGRKAMVEQRFGERLVRDNEWQLRHLGVPLDHLGMCDESGGTMVTCTVSNADKCDAFRPR